MKNKIFGNLMPQSFYLLVSPNFEEKWTSLRIFKGSKVRDFLNFYAKVPLTVAKLAYFSLKFGLIIVGFSLIFWSFNYFSSFCFAETKFLNKTDSFASLFYKSKAASACFASILNHWLKNTLISLRYRDFPAIEG